VNLKCLCGGQTLLHLQWSLLCRYGITFSGSNEFNSGILSRGILSNNAPVKGMEPVTINPFSASFWHFSHPVVSGSFAKTLKVPTRLSS